jgi:hypothetical protein
MIRYEAMQALIANDERNVRDTLATPNRTALPSVIADCAKHYLAARDERIARWDDARWFDLSVRAAINLRKALAEWQP